MASCEQLTTWIPTRADHKQDAGASGIIVPHTETVEQVKAIVKACRFRSADVSDHL